MKGQDTLRVGGTRQWAEPKSPRQEPTVSVRLEGRYPERRRSSLSSRNTKRGTETVPIRKLVHAASSACRARHPFSYQSILANRDIQDHDST